MSHLQHQEEEFTGRVGLGTWAKILRQARPYRRELGALVVCALTLAGLDVGFPLLTRAIVDSAVAGRADGLWRYAGVYLAMVVLFASLVNIFIRLAGRISTYLSHDVRGGLFSHVQDLSFSYFDRRPVGWLVARLTSDCSRLTRIIGWGTLDAVWSVAMLLAISAAMLYLNWRLALIVISVIPALMLVSWYFQGRILRASREVRRVNSELTAAYNEGISGVRTTKTLAREDHSLGEFRNRSGEMFAFSVREALLHSMYMPLVLSIGSVGTGLVLWLGGVQAHLGDMTLGDLFAFIIYSGQFFYPVHELARVLTELQAAQAAAERVVGLLETKPEIADNAEVRQRFAEGGDGGEAIESIEFRDVGFGYAQGSPVLEGFNLTVSAGQTIALVGPTGGGKTTIVSLVCRFYEPTAGAILINGADYRQRPLAWLQSQLGVVLQTPHLFSGTVRENIRYGRLSASDAEVEQAARTVGAEEFILAMEAGYESQVGQGGGKLSTGQRQLVSFARAVLADPQVFVMDEATSSIDARAEAAIQSAMKRLLSGRISFVIAHRLSTIRSADRILVIDGGRIVEQGTHGQLLRQRGSYYDLYTQQFQREQEDRILGQASP